MRVAGPFTVESLSPHRVVPADEEELIDLIDADEGKRRRAKRTRRRPISRPWCWSICARAGVHQSEKRDTIRFTSLTRGPANISAPKGASWRARPSGARPSSSARNSARCRRVDLVAAAREATDARFDVLIACAFNFDAHASELSKLGPLPILKAKMNPDLHMADDLKNTGKGNLFVVFGEPDIDIEHESDGGSQ